MEKYITVTDQDAAGAEKIKIYRHTCHDLKRPCIIITEHATHADISCDNWLSTDNAIITVENRMMMEDQFQQLQKLHAGSGLQFNTSEVKASEISNPIPLWYNFTHVPLAEAPALAERIYDIYSGALPFGEGKNL